MRKLYDGRKLPTPDTQSIGASHNPLQEIKGRRMQETADLTLVPFVDLSFIPGCGAPPNVNRVAGAGCIGRRTERLVQFDVLAYYIRTFYAKTPTEDPVGVIKGTSGRSIRLMKLFDQSTFDRV